MREIKFRAWDKDLKIMRYGNEFYQLALFFDGGMDYLFNKSKFIPMQSTNLHDKNGVEIFEGDVFTNGYKNFVVKFGDGFDEQTDCSFVGFYIHSKELNGYWALTRDVIDEDGSKVIGNIHENPELIK